MMIFTKKSFWIAAVTTLICSLAGKYLALVPGFSLVGALVIALLCGMLFQTASPVIYASIEGIGFISNKFLRLGIILLGFRLNLYTLAESGIKTILLALIVVTGTILLTYWLCRVFHVENRLAILTASGCGICGAAAVMGVSPQVKADKDDAVLAVAVVCIMGTVFTLIEIGLKPLLGFSDGQFGVMAGASLHEIAHAVAAGGSAGMAGLDAAIITKLSRVILLAPAALFIGIWYTRRSAGRGEPKGKLPIPWFMAGFLLSSAIGSFLPISQALIDGLVSLAYLFLGMAMAALGMSVNFKVIAERGGKVFLAAGISSVVLLGFTMLASKLFF
ncbi:YeiH family protein [Listeria aquatica]|uniref:YeiH family protein n=1 Tax=Listeria aquatica TaxID=1494960 RepID=UPI003F4AEC77